MRDRRISTEDLIMSYSTLAKNICNVIKYPDINTFDEQQLNAFLEQVSFAEEEKQKIRESEDKNITYKAIREKRNRQDSFTIFNMYNSFYEQNKSYLSPDLQKQIETASDQIWNKWVSQTYKTP